MRVPTLEAPPPLSTAKRTRVLVVDDEPEVRRVLRRSLATAHDVVPLPSAAEALAWLATDAAFDAIICDLSMPEMTGIELHAVLRQHQPQLAGRMVFVSGGSVDDDTDAFLCSVSNPCLEKPFDPGELRDVVCQLIASREETKA